MLKNHYLDNGRVRLDAEGRRWLQCHSRGAKEYSPFFCFVESFGQVRSIEDHYQTTKIFRMPEGHEIRAINWRQAKLLQKEFLHEGEWQRAELVGFELPNGIKLGAENRSVDDLVIQYYIALWYRYLRQHPELIEAARGFDGYEDIFEGKFPFSQASVMEQCVTHGLESLVPLFEPLRTRLRQAG